MKPDLELVQIGAAQSFKAWEHGYPYRTVRWHFHPEYELHQVVATQGRCFIGDHIGDFTPGHLVLVGPNLPHNWVSDLPQGAHVPLRSRVLQFTDAFVSGLAQLCPEVAGLEGLFAQSRRGVLFDAATSADVQPLMADLVHATGLGGLALFLQIMGLLDRARSPVLLTSGACLPAPATLGRGMNEALAFIDANLTERFSEADLAERAGLSTSTFSRRFSKHTGQTMVQYVNRLRVNLACQMLMGRDPMRITEICYAAGFNNLSNFNRQFLAQKGMTPSRFRAMLKENKSLAEAA